MFHKYEMFKEIFCIYFNISQFVLCVEHFKFIVFKDSYLS